ncbi:MAG: hypothetical protein DI587_17025 [Variovorax paradoxus]|nr:MAG: hypothetical protein DI583_17025 [Variovorax paradoxus]PZQ08938.1 MAG: hypothetical protein DI587_17025 [Variovorax paradoxus]
MTAIVPPPQIAELPPPPTITDPKPLFNTRAFALVGALPPLVQQTNATSAATYQNAVAASEQAADSAASADVAAGYRSAALVARDQAQAFAQSAVNAPGTSGTSPSSIGIGSGGKILTTQAGKAFVAGQTVAVAATASPTAQRMVGVITSYNASTGVMTFDVPEGAFQGSGAPASWIISLTTARDGLVQQGTGVGQGNNAVKIGWANDNSGRLRATVDSTHIGEFVFDGQLTGLVGFFAVNAIPLGWLKINSANVSRVTYARLWAAMGYPNTGDGSTTFTLPEIRGEGIRALDDGRGIDPGRVLLSWQAGQNMAHAHGVNDVTHTHGVNDPPHAHTASTAGAGGHDHTVPIGPNNTGRGLQDGSTSYANSAAVSGMGPVSTSLVPNHNHGVTVNGANTGITLQPSFAGISIQSSGGSEALMRNVALVACIHI